MCQIKIFEKGDLGAVRIIAEGDEMWFVGKDVAMALEYASTNMPTIFKAVPDEWKGSKRITTPGGEQEMLVISEQGLYFFLGRSDKPKALPYQMWIAGEVVPSIRKTGKYELQKAIPSAPNFRNPAEAARAWADEYERRMLAEAETREWGRKAIENHPKVLFANAVSGARGAMTVGSAAKIITQGLPTKIGRNRLFKWLHQNGWLMREGRYWVPTQRAIEKGYLALKIKTTQVGKYIFTAPELRITMRGANFFYEEMSRQYLY